MKRIASILALWLILTVAGIAYASFTTATYILPNGTGAYTQLTRSTGAANYECVDDPVGSPDDASSYVLTTSSSQKKDAYELTTPTFSGSDQTIVNLSVFFRHKAASEATNPQIQPFLRLSSGTETPGTIVNCTDSWVTSNETLARPGGGSWSIADLTDLQVAIGLKSDGTYQVWCTQVYVQVAYTTEEAQAPSYSLGQPPPFITYTDNTTGNFTTTSNPVFPGSKIIQAVANASGTPSQLPFVIIAGVCLISVSLSLGWFLRRFGNNSLFVKTAVMIGMMGICVAVRWLDLWILVMFVIIAVALAWGSKHTSWAS